MICFHICLEIVIFTQEVVRFTTIVPDGTTSMGTWYPRKLPTLTTAFFFFQVNDILFSTFLHLTSICTIPSHMPLNPFHFLSIQFNLNQGPITILPFAAELSFFYNSCHHPNSNLLEHCDYAFMFGFQYACIECFAHIVVDDITLRSGTEERLCPMFWILRH
ncbi:hypothetical protein DITRI_Ditri17bG0059900 [Diplodiscus trichospermus]